MLRRDLQGRLIQRGRIRVIIRIKPHRIFLAPKPCELPFRITARLLFDVFHRLCKRAAPLKIRAQLLVADGLRRGAGACAALLEKEFGRLG